MRDLSTRRRQDQATPSLDFRGPGFGDRFSQTELGQALLLRDTSGPSRQERKATAEPLTTVCVDTEAIRALAADMAAKHGINPASIGKN